MVIDIIFLLTAAYGFYTGYSRGIINTVFTVLSWMFGVMAALKFAPGMTRFLESTLNNTNPMMFVAGSLLSFVLMMVLIRMIGSTLQEMLQAANVNMVNQFAGGGLMALIFSFVFSVLLWFGDQARLVNEPAKRESFTYPLLKDLPAQGKMAIQTFVPIFKEFWANSSDAFDRIRDMSVQKTETDPNVYDIPDDNTRQQHREQRGQ
jgi:membrane protein required for colicin V production